jgi:hypothetical protein
MILIKARVLVVNHNNVEENEKDVNNSAVK